MAFPGKSVIKMIGLQTSCRTAGLISDGIDLSKSRTASR